MYTHILWEVVDHSRGKMHETCLIIIHDPSMKLYGITSNTVTFYYMASLESRCSDLSCQNEIHVSSSIEGCWGIKDQGSQNRL